VALGILATESAAGQIFRFILIDAQMPQSDGFELARQIREYKLPGEVIMMLTTSDLAADSARCRELGIGLYVLKPIRQTELRDVLLTPQNSRFLAEVIPALRAAEEQSSARLLLVEDNLTNQKLALRLLAKRGYSVAVAGNGAQAIEEFRRQPFDLVLMDIQMPGMGGYEATSVIRELEKDTGSRTPIIALTAHAMKGDQERCMEAGMDDYVTKPVQAQELFRKIEQHLSFPEHPRPAETVSH
jgi:CheY-like chemotaxis protein